MKQELQNKIIAAHCGWRQSKNPQWEGWWHEKGKRTYQRFCPDFCNDLNAMHQAEKILKTKKEKELYWNYFYEHCERTVFSRVKDNFKLIHSYAPQRAEAFLRTIGKWEDT